MAQVTMDGKEYIELVNRTRKSEAAVEIMINAFVKGELLLDPTSSYRKVEYKTYATIPEEAHMKMYCDMRVAHMVECLEQNPLAVQLLFDEKDGYINPNGGSFTSYGWDNNLEIRKQSEKLDEMWTALEEGDRLVEEPVEKEEEEA